MSSSRPAPSPALSTRGEPLRVSFRQPVTGDGYIDAAWWPRSTDLVAESQPLLESLWSVGREITRLTYNLGAWNPTPRRITIGGRSLRLGGYALGARDTVRLSDAWGAERIDVLVVAPDTEPALAERILRLASESGSLRTAEQIVAEATAATGRTEAVPA